MVFSWRLRDGVRRGDITCSIRIWQRPRVVAGSRHRMENGQVRSVWSDTGTRLTPLTSALTLSLLMLGAEARAVELRPTLSAGVADIVGQHGSLSAALRVQVATVLFVQAEYLVLPGDGHRDKGLTFMAGLSTPRKDRLRPFLGLGGGPVRGYGGDDGMVYLAAGATQPVGRNRRAFLQAEFRMGLLGESGYRQVTVGIGVSR